MKVPSLNGLGDNSQTAATINNATPWLPPIQPLSNFAYNLATEGSVWDMYLNQAQDDTNGWINQLLTYWCNGIGQPCDLAPVLSANANPGFVAAAAVVPPAPATDINGNILADALPLPSTWPTVLQNLQSGAQDAVNFQTDNGGDVGGSNNPDPTTNILVWAAIAVGGFFLVKALVK